MILGYTQLFFIFVAALFIRRAIWEASRLMLGADFGRKYIATALSLIISHSKMHIIAAL